MCLNCLLLGTSGLPGPAEVLGDRVEVCGRRLCLPHTSDWCPAGLGSPHLPASRARQHWRKTTARSPQQIRALRVLLAPCCPATKFMPVPEHAPAAGAGNSRKRVFAEQWRQLCAGGAGCWQAVCVAWHQCELAREDAGRGCGQLHACFRPARVQPQGKGQKVCLASSVAT